MRKRLSMWIAASVLLVAAPTFGIMLDSEKRARLDWHTVSASELAFLLGVQSWRLTHAPPAESKMVYRKLILHRPGAESVTIASYGHSNVTYVDGMIESRVLTRHPANPPRFEYAIGSQDGMAIWGVIPDPFTLEGAAMP